MEINRFNSHLFIYSARYLETEFVSIYCTIAISELINDFLYNVATQFIRKNSLGLCSLHIFSNLETGIIHFVERYLLHIINILNNSNTKSIGGPRVL